MSSQHSKVLRGVEHLLLAAGLALLVVYLSARFHGVVMYRAGLWSFAALKSSPPAAKDERERQPAAGVDFSLWSGKRVKAYTDALATRLGAPLAVLSIPKLGLCVPVFEGTDELTLNRGVGRIAGTARPGEQGNIGVAGHRDGFFRGLKDIQMGDRIELAVLRRTFVYTVDNVAVVKPSDVGVLQTKPKPSLTLVTCYPFYFVGDAPQRYIVRASLADSEQPTVSELNPEFPKLNKEKAQ
ncbi:MAG: class D sortase [Terriglobales bacterium]|jgi:sortase A